MLAEVAERGLALTGTRHLLLVGGVACECGGRGLVGGAWPGWEGGVARLGAGTAFKGVWPVGKGRGHTLGAWFGLEGAWSHWGGGCDQGGVVMRFGCVACGWRGRGFGGMGLNGAWLVSKGRGQVFGVWSGMEGAWPVGKGAGLPSMGRGLTPGGVAPSPRQPPPPGDAADHVPSPGGGALSHR